VYVQHSARRGSTDACAPPGAKAHSNCHVQLQSLYPPRHPSGRVQKTRLVTPGPSPHGRAVLRCHRVRLGAMSCWRVQLIRCVRLGGVSPPLLPACQRKGYKVAAQLWSSGVTAARGLPHAVALRWLWSGPCDTCTGCVRLPGGWTFALCAYALALVCFPARLCFLSAYIVEHATTLSSCPFSLLHT
jgi:hypothetical protein